MTIQNDARLLLEFDNARAIFAPEYLKSEGFTPELVDAVSDIIESNPDDPKETAFDNNGRMMNQVRGVIVLDLAYEIAKRMNLKFGNTCFGWQRQLSNVKDAIRVKLSTV